MIVEVHYENWQMECCGDPFAVGDGVSWLLHGANPQEWQSAGCPVLIEDHHGQVLPYIPNPEISGRVRSIEAVAVRPHKTPVFRSWSADSFDTILVPIDRLDRGWKGQPSDYRVEFFRIELDVPDEIELPKFVADRQHVKYEAKRAAAQQRAIVWLTDSVSVELVALADSLATRLLGIGELTRTEYSAAVDALPADPATCPVWWSRGKKWIELGVGHGTWRLPVKPGLIDDMREYIDAAIDGRVEERTKPRSLETVVSLSGGKESVSRTDFPYPPAGERSAYVPVGLAKRMRAGHVNYAPWPPASPLRP